MPKYSSACETIFLAIPYNSKLLFSKLKRPRYTSQNFFFFSFHCPLQPIAKISSSSKYSDNFLTKSMWCPARDLTLNLFLAQIAIATLSKLSYENLKITSGTSELWAILKSLSAELKYFSICLSVNSCFLNILIRFLLPCR